ncbi:hypothetical protein [Azospirillum sp. sgz301742]
MTAINATPITAEMIQAMLSDKTAYDKFKEHLAIQVECTLYDEATPDYKASVRDTLAANCLLGYALALEANTPLTKQSVANALVHAAAYLLREWCPPEMAEEAKTTLAQVLLADGDEIHVGHRREALQ